MERISFMIEAIAEEMELEPNVSAFLFYHPTYHPQDFIQMDENELGAGD